MRTRLRTIALAGLAVTVVGAPAAADAAVIKTGGSTGLQLLAQKLATAYQKDKGVKVTVAGGGSGAGIRGANTGTFDIGNSSRKPAASDPAGLWFTPVTKEPFVVIVKPSSLVRTLTKAQIKGIFTGQITNWRQVGGRPGAIKVYSRIGTSGTLTTFRSLFLDDAPVTASAPTLASSALVRSKVANDPDGNAIGFVTFAYTATSTTVRALNVAGVAPTLKNVISNRYTYWGYQYFVTKGAPAGPSAAYLNWVRSAKGAAVMKNLAIPTTVAAEKT
jgi:phosphate transport system substrate-binding protein